MIRTLKYAAILAAAFGACDISAAYAGEGWWNPDQSRWERNEWARPPQERPGYENLNDCGPGSHGVPFPNGNGFRCVPNGW
jgi:hypothetical protein